MRYSLAVSCSGVEVPPGPAGVSVINGSLSGECVYRAALPQGSVLAPTLFLLWSPSLAPSSAVPEVSSFPYVNDTAALCSSNDMRTATRRAQGAADTMVRSARWYKIPTGGG